ncbi:MAG: hypothetical protein M3Y81_25465 [Chloroflexota bacterium]|nr:hypothetical protein [Chloroflexota bacterium]
MISFEVFLALFLILVASIAINGMISVVSTLKLERRIEKLEALQKQPAPTREGSE